jgi:hypothetical protein
MMEGKYLEAATDFVDDSHCSHYLNVLGSTSHPPATNHLPRPPPRAVT